MDRGLYESAPLWYCSMCTYLETRRANKGGNLQPPYPTMTPVANKDNSQGRAGGSLVVLAHVECKNAGIHTSHRDVGGRMARSMIGLSRVFSLVHYASDKFCQLCDPGRRWV